MTDSLARSFRIGSVLIDPPLALAPMAEVTDTYYRSLIKELGGAGLVVSEFISAEGLTRKNDRSHQMLAFAENERPVSIQIYGGDPSRMDDAAAIVEAQGVDIVDINMGCPVKKIVNTGAGSGMLRDFDRAARTVDKITRRVKIPVTVKVRKGWESDDVLPLLKRFEDIGVSAIAIHGRTRSEAYTGASDWKYIAMVKSELRIPVFGNGDVKTPADAIRMFEETKVDGVMIGRAALQNPFIFRDIHAYAAGRPPMGNEVEHRIDAMQRYLGKIEGAPQIEKWKLHKARTVIGWFSRGIPHGKDIRLGLQDITSVADVQRLLDRSRETIAA
ncbi:MAG TPA: tRNA dihydrouridine synthase DusB [Thermoanaerobaculia bacterium]|jgi:tRNA-dihydrouridine synthase B|nr:tRNA dihydrouridine synthase DusB [Thermoanaerobaculia bacterium]